MFLHVKERVTLMVELNDSTDINYFKKRTQETLGKILPIDISLVELEKKYLGMFRLHWHSEVEFDYLISGTAYFTCGEKTYFLHPGESIFINQNVKHSITPGDENDTHFIRLVFMPSHVIGFGMIELNEKYIHPLLNHPEYHSIHFTADHPLNDFMGQMINSIYKNVSELSWGYELDVRSDIIQLWSSLCKECLNRNPENSSTIASNQDEYRIHNAIVYIQEHYAEPITLDDISNSIMVSKSECCRCFKRCLNMRPFEYLMHYRITESAKQMQYHSIASIADIATSVGFNNTSYYNKIFKKYMNCTPTEYRRQIK